MAFIEISQLSKHYKNKNALNNISFGVEKGEILAVAGDNGAGKSTLLGILSTLLHPTEGCVFFGGIDIVQQPRLARKIMSYIPQETALQTQLTLNDNLDFWACMNGLNKKERKFANERIINLLELEPFLKTRVMRLPGGIKKRANIAAALYNNPQILLMDEATAGIDSESRKKILDFVLSEKNKGTAIIFVTHMTDEIRYINDKILRLKDGQLEFFGNVSDLPYATDLYLL